MPEGPLIDPTMPNAASSPATPAPGAATEGAGEAVADAAVETPAGAESGDGGEGTVDANGRAHAPDGTFAKTVPYDRFSEVVGERNEARGNIAAMAHRIGQLEATLESLQAAPKGGTPAERSAAQAEVKHLLDNFDIAPDIRSYLIGLERQLKTADERLEKFDELSQSIAQKEKAAEVQAYQDRVWKHFDGTLNAELDKLKVDKDQALRYRISRDVIDNVKGAQDLSPAQIGKYAKQASDFYTTRFRGSEAAVARAAAQASGGSIPGRSEGATAPAKVGEMSWAEIRAEGNRLFKELNG